MKTHTKIIIALGSIAAIGSAMAGTIHFKLGSNMNKQLNISAIYSDVVGLNFGRPHCTNNACTVSYNGTLQGKEVDIYGTAGTQNCTTGQLIRPDSLGLPGSIVFLDVQSASSCEISLANIGK